ncbi:MAG: glycoside hydrolase family 99-like domain-containing protein [Fimbriimonadaceae bacterium]|nr:glycoside hydrolase family 99-like domain-containing protein [Fimbriimonadaceae bacterium]
MSAAVRSAYDIAAFIWPSYHPDPRARVFWPDGIGEWQTVISNAPKFEGHAQPRYPLWGYVNEADPYVMEMQIEAAVDHGVNTFIYDWYWYDGLPYLEGCLNDGFLGAKNNHKMKFYLMWANHDVPLGWDKRNADDAFTGRNRALIWRGGMDRAEFERAMRRVIEKYFGHPSYYRVDGKPVFMLYELQTFLAGLGGLEPGRAALQWLRDETVRAGFPGLELQLTLRRDSERSLSVIPGDSIGTQRETVESLAFDSLTHYQFCHFVDVNRDYNVLMEDVAQEWELLDATYAVPYHPHVSVGWDSSPRAHHYRGAITTNNTPDNFAAALRRAKAYVDAHPQQAPLITINSWNEWTETSYLQPCTMFGYGYLQAVREVFGSVAG